MADTSPPRRSFSPDVWLTRLVARPAFQDWVAKTPILSRLANRDGAALFDLVQGFVKAQVLFALVQLDIPRRLTEEPTHPETLAQMAGLPVERMALLLRAGVGTGLLKQRRDGSFTVTRQGAALTGVPGLQDMILHHGAFYRDMGDPVALLKGDAPTELAAFWPYVFGADGAVDPAVTDRYSNLMADTQSMVARDTLQAVSLNDVGRLMDVGGGSGAFLVEVAKAYSDLDLILFDLPTVAAAADHRIEKAGQSNRIAVVTGSFRDQPLPTGADAISLVRVLYDHSDDTVLALLRSCHQTLPIGGRLIISEPMSGKDTPDPITDVYFAFYTMAMRTGRTRSSGEISKLLAQAGFRNILCPSPKRSFVTSVVTAVRGA